MDRNTSRLFQVNLASLKPWLVTFAIIWLLGTLGLGWIVKSFLILILLLAIAPIIIVFGVTWWWQNKLVVDKCPVCNFELTGFKDTSFPCPNCGEPLQIGKNSFERLTPPNTIDVRAIEVPVERLED